MDNNYIFLTLMSTIKHWSKEDMARLQREGRAKPKMELNVVRVLNYIIKGH